MVFGFETSEYYEIVPGFVFSAIAIVVVFFADGVVLFLCVYSFRRIGI